MLLTSCSTSHQTLPVSPTTKQEYLTCHTGSQVNISIVVFGMHSLGSFKSVEKAQVCLQFRKLNLPRNY
jgi:hypothetical protein